ncbi:DNaJ domain (Prokaryotic heat shock protein), partial [Trichostrongylus colubriformis]
MSAGDLSLAVALYGFLPRTKQVEQAGHSYECSVVRDKITLGKCTRPVLRYSPVQDDDESSMDEIDGIEDRSAWYDADDEKYERYLMKLDPNDTKNQDHYKVLGLSKLRFRATLAEIRTCYRAKVLKYHPDKKKHRGETLPAGEDYFTCITRAYEQLGMSEAKRQAYDSVDHKFNDAIPSEKSVNKDNFFNELAPVFERNSRWSTRQPVPSLGKIDSTRADVEAFYNFWFDFSSWREFSYLDEEDKERGEDRYERRELEKINKAERERRRKEEAKRIRRLVELAYSKDPRIAMFKKEDQEMKNKAKEEKQRKQREKAEAAERERREKEEAEMKVKEEQERLMKEEREREKKEKEAAKKVAAAQRRRFKKLAEAANHWAENDEEKLEGMERVERLCLFLSADEMSSLCDTIEKASSREDIWKLCQMPRRPSGMAPQKLIRKIQLLVKASNTYPAGTVDRWIIIAEYINEHRKDKSTPPKTEKQVIRQCKAVQSMNVKLPATTQNQLGTSLPDEDSWTITEQKLLEQAIKTFPASDAERWDK